MPDLIRAGAVWGFSQLVQQLGHEPAPLFAEAGFSASDFDDPDRYLPRPPVADMIENAARSLNCPDFGLRLAAFQDIHVLGALAFAIRYASNVRDAIDTASRHLHYISPAADVWIESRGADHRIVFALQTTKPAPQFTEHAVGLFVRVRNHLLEAPPPLKGITFRHRQLASVETYKKHLALFPQFGCANDAALMAARDFDLPLKAANRPLQAIVETYLKTHAAESGGQLVQEVRQVLARLMLAAPETALREVADVLRLHPRALQRRLTANGTTFERVRDEVRRALAETYLAHTGAPIAEVSDLLGYANQSVLTRSCIRWFGQTPLTIRRQFSNAVR